MLRLRMYGTEPLSPLCLRAVVFNEAQESLWFSPVLLESTYSTLIISSAIVTYFCMVSHQPHEIITTSPQNKFY